MNRFVKKALTLFVTAAAALNAAFIAPDALSLCITASAAETKTDDWDGTYTVDKSGLPDGCTYSLKTENETYNISQIKKTFTVKPNTEYIFSAMVKYLNRGFVFCYCHSDRYHLFFAHLIMRISI